MAGNKRTWVRQAYMKRSFMRSRTTAIYDCWPDPFAGARSGFGGGLSAMALHLNNQAKIRQQLTSQP